MQRIYLDYNASTPVAPEVLAVMGHAMDGAFGNPSSPHRAGVPAREIVEKARQQVATLIGSDPEELVFTSGGSEANNFALKGAFFASKRARRHIITTQIEHPTIVAPRRFLERLGAVITWLPDDGAGRIDPDDLSRVITTDTILISIMHANNEVGTNQLIEDCAAIAREFHASLRGVVSVCWRQVGTEIVTEAAACIDPGEDAGQLALPGYNRRTDMSFCHR